MQIDNLSLVLHPGGAKSGSTFLQTFVQKNRKELEAQGLAYWHEFRDLDFASLSDASGADGFKQELLAGIEKAVADTKLDRVLLSYENVFGDPMTVDGMYANAPAIARNMLPVLREFKDVKVVFVLRRLDEFLLSQYNQRKKQGAKISFKAFTELCEKRAYTTQNILEALRIYSELFDIKVIEFDLLRDRPKRFCGDFLATCEVKVGQNFTFQGLNDNPSVNASGIKILEFAKDLLSKSEYVELRKFMQAKMPKTGYETEELAFIASWKGRSDEDYQAFIEECLKFSKVVRSPGPAKKMG